MFFLQGTRDNLAKLELIEPLLNNLPLSQFEILEGGNHSFAFTKKYYLDEAGAVMLLAQKSRSFLNILYTNKAINPLYENNTL